MNRADIGELHFITPIANVASILEHGILSNRRAAQFPHTSLAMEKVQDKRRGKYIPGARPLHEYANLYFDAHNPMLSKRRDQNDTICVLRIDHTVLDWKGVIVSDGNAASNNNYVRFYPAVDGIMALDRELVFARFWLNQKDPLDQDRRKKIKCAEVLVPDLVQPSLILGSYVANNLAFQGFQELASGLPVKINGAMFF